MRVVDVRARTRGDEVAGVQDALRIEGAPEALGLSGSVLTVSVYFETEADAQAAAAAFEARGVPGVVAEVRTFCLD